MSIFDNYAENRPNLFERARRLFGSDSSAPVADASAIRANAAPSISRNPPRARAAAPEKPSAAPAATRAASVGTTQVAGRASQDQPEIFGDSLQSLLVFSNNSYWRQFALSESISLGDLQKVSIERIAELLADVSPEVSNGLHIRTILSNTGYEIEAINPANGEKDEAAQKELDAMRARVAYNYGTEDVFYNQLFSTLWLRGAIFSEAIFDAAGKKLIDIATPDPKTLAFRKARDPLRGMVNDYGQIQAGQFVSLRNVPTVQYIPLNPFPNRIEGRPIIASSFFIAVFIMAVLRDFKRVVQQQGYPRYDIEIDLEQMKDLMPEDAEDDDGKFEAWAAGVKQAVISYIEQLEPDDTFVHFKGVTVNAPVGALGTNAMTAIDGLFKGLERMAARALKVPPLFMGITDGVSEANANRQFEAFLKDLENGQHMIENGIGAQYTLGLQAAGQNAVAKFRFATMRASERLRDAQADLIEATLAQMCAENAWIDNDEAARRGAKVKAAVAPEPHNGWGGAKLQQQNVNNVAGGTGAPDQGVNRFNALLPPEFRAPTLPEINAARKLFEENAPDEFADLITAPASDASAAN